MAEVVRRRYTRLLKESKDEGRESRAEGGEAIPQALQELVDDVSAAARRRAELKAAGDASSEAVREHRAPGDLSGRAPNLPDLILIDGGKGQLEHGVRRVEETGAGGNSNHRTGQGV